MAVRRIAAWLFSDRGRGTDRDWTFNLAIFRLVFLGFVALPMAAATLSWAADTLPGVPRDAWQPISFYRWLPLDWLAHSPTATWLAAANVALIVLALLGIAGRLALALATLLSLYLFGLPNCFGKVDHFHHVIWFMALLAAGPSTAVLSADAALAAWRAGRAGTAAPPVPPRAALATLRCVWILFGLIFFLTGLDKLRAALTAGWVNAEQVRLLVRATWFNRRLYLGDVRPLVSIEGAPDWLLTAGAAGVIAFQLSFLPLVLLRPVRPLLAVAGILFHRVTAAVLGIWFVWLVPAYAVLIDWVAFGRQLLGRLGLGPVAVLHDPACRLSRTVLAIVRAFDALDLVRPTADAPRAGHDLVVLDDRGETRRGPRALRLALARVPFLWPLWPLAGLYEVLRRVDRHGDAAAPAARRGRYPVAAVGALLIAGQALVSATVGLARVPVWPFDRYPTFTEAREPEVALWEARAVLADGTEVPLDAWRATCVRWNVCHHLRRSLVSIRDPETRRARSTELSARLLRHAPAALREAAREIATYEVVTRLDARPVVVARRPLDRFPAPSGLEVPRL